jgi:hypothetical protein
MHEFAQYEEYTRRELPRLVRRNLELRAIQSSSVLEEQLRGELVGIVRDCQLELSRAYQQAHLPQALTSGRADLPMSSPETTNREVDDNTRPETTVDISPYVAPPPVTASSDNHLDMMWGGLPLGLNTFSDSGFASMERFDLDHSTSFNQHCSHEQNTDNIVNPADSADASLVFQPMDVWLFEP